MINLWIYKKTEKDLKNKPTSSFFPFVASWYPVEAPPTGTKAPPPGDASEYPGTEPKIGFS